MFKLAWRNLWRNKRRTFITIASVMFAVMFAILMRGYHGGAWSSLIDNVLHSYSGYMQVHAKGFWEEKSFDYSMSWNDTIEKKILSVRNVQSVIPRIESMAFASIGDKTKIVFVLGIDPQKEDVFSGLSNKIVSGNMLNGNDSSVLISQRLARFLNIGIGDTLTLLSQGYQAYSAAGLFKVKGIVKLPSPEYDNKIIYLPLKTAQNFYSMEGRVTSLVIDLKNNQKLHKTYTALTDKLGTSKYEIMTWEKLMVELYQQYVSDEGGGKIFLGLLYLIIGFGIFGTVMMMVAERTHEFGVLIAVGMKRSRLFRLITTEMLLIGFMGVITGMMVSMPLVAWFHFHPIKLTGSMAKTMEVYGMAPEIPVLWQADYIIWQGLIVFLITLIAIVYPVFKVWKLDIIKSMRG